MSIVPTAAPIQHSINLTTNSSVQSQPNSGSTNTTLSTANNSRNDDFSNLNVAALSSFNKTSQSNSSSTSLPSLKNQPPTLPAQSQVKTEQQNQQQQQQHQPIYDDINIFMWSVCKICNKSSKKISMSPDTWTYSLAKFLELTFHGKTYHQFNNFDTLECNHSLFNDHYQYFRFKNIVTVFSLSKINLNNIFLPAENLKTAVKKLIFYKLKNLCI
jgi:hypothetical protein